MIEIFNFNSTTYFCFFRSFTACIPARYILSILGSIAMAIIYGLKVNLSVAMVAMVNHTAVKMQNPHGADNHSTTLSMNSNVSLSEECEADIRNSTGSDNSVSLSREHHPSTKRSFPRRVFKQSKSHEKKSNLFALFFF